VETDDGLSRLEIKIFRRDVSVWVNGDFDDSINTKEDFLETYGTKFFRSKKDFKKDISCTFEDLIKEQK
jgi:hypothetical protein